MGSTILQEWNITDLTGIPNPVLAGLAADPHRGLLWLTERTSHQILRLDLFGANSFLSRRLDVVALGDIAVNDDGRLYVCDQGKPALYILSAALSIEHIIPLTNPLLNVASTTGGGIITISRASKSQMSFQASRYSRQGEEMWRWSCPTGVSQAIAVPGESQNTFVVTQSSQISIYQLDGDGRLLDVREIADADNTTKAVWTPSGSKINAMPVNLHDAEKGADPTTSLILYTPPNWKHLDEMQLIFYSWDIASQTFVIPRCRRIAMVGSDKIAAYWNNITAQVCKVVLFSLPT